MPKWLTPKYEEEPEEEDVPDVTPGDLGVGSIETNDYGPPLKSPRRIKRKVIPFGFGK